MAVLAVAAAAAPCAAQRRDLGLTESTERRVALVVGNNDYAYAPSLRNAVNDAQDLSRTLEDLGFEVDTLLNADLRTFDQAVDRFIATLAPGDVALFHYSGHGMEVDGENYLIPTDFQLKDPASVRYDAYSASKLHDRMAGAASRLNIMMLDACRNNGFQSSRASSGGLAMMNAAEGSFIAFATGPGQTADDGVASDNGLFTEHLLEAIQEPGVPLDEVFNRVRERVYEASGNRQLPWTSSSVIGDFYFRWKLPEVAPPAPAPPVKTLGEPSVQMELAYWDSIKDGSNPALFEAYLAKYPEGHFSDLARIRLEELKPPPQPEPAPAEPEPTQATAPSPAPPSAAETAPTPAQAQSVSVERLPVVVGQAGIQTRIATTVPELQALANSRPDRGYSVFQAQESERYQAIGRHGAQLMVSKIDAKKGRYTLTLREGAGSAARPGPGPSRTAPSLRPETKSNELADTVGRTFELKNARPGEPVQFHAQGDACDEIVILEVHEDRIIGYLVEAVR